MPPGSPLPALAQTLHFGVNPTAFMEHCRRRYGDVFTVRFASFIGTSVLVADPGLLKQVFTADGDVLTGGDDDSFLEPLMGPRSVLLLDGEAHRRKRRLVLPAFHHQAVERYRDVVRAAADGEIDRWRAGAVAPMRPRMQAVTLEVIIEAVFGASLTAELRRRLRTAMGTLIRRTFRVGPPLLMVLARRPEWRRARWAPWSGFQRSIEALEELVLAEVRRRRRESGEHADVLGLFVAARDEDGSGLDDAEIRDEVFTLLFAGYETSATALSWALLLLAHHPEVTARLRADLEAGGREYLGAVVNETLRVRPPLALTGRRVLRPFDLGPYRLPPGVSVAPCIYLLHRHPDLYEEPDAFRPERFLGADPPRYGFVPFGGGDRRCLGANLAVLEIEVVLDAVVGRVDLSPSSPVIERIRRRNIVFTPGRDATLRIDAVR